jgi:NADH:ubiquinone oxidoreductase subunit 2 (subunit N)
MNASLITLEVCVITLGIVLMLADFFAPAERKRYLGYAAIAALAGLLLISFSGNGVCSLSGTAFHGMFVEDALAVFFKRFFLVAAILVLFMSADSPTALPGAFRNTIRSSFLRWRGCASPRRPMTSPCSSCPLN